MDISYVENDITFTWDADKAEKNVAKHGITFEQASTAFFDPFLSVVDASQNFEQRDAIIAMDPTWQLLFVVHIQVENDSIRLISARRATKQEHRNYED